MQIFNLKINTNKKILALGAELDTTLAYYYQGKIIVSDNLGETANNPILLEKKIMEFCRDEAMPRLYQPDYILTDLHPEYSSVKIGAKLAKKWNIPQIKIQHHVAHIFSGIVEHYLLDTAEISNFQFPISNKFLIPQFSNIKNSKFIQSATADKIQNSIIGIACDGTGYGLDDTIWGGEIFNFQFPISNFQTNSKSQISNSKHLQATNYKLSANRVGHLEYQTLIGGHLAVEEPGRMLLAILTKFLDEQKLYSMIKKFYNKKTFKLLYSQLRQNFNCQQTSSTARVLDAACALLFDCNERKFKHQAARMLEEAAVEAKPYDDIKPIIVKHETCNMKQETISNFQFSIFNQFSPPLADSNIKNSKFIQNSKLKIKNSFINYKLPTTSYKLMTTPLFEYLTKNINADKSRLAATVHQYIADGLLKIANKFKIQNSKFKILMSGGLANNQIFRRYFEQKGALTNKKIPSGDPGISVGQIGWFLMN